MISSLSILNFPLILFSQKLTLMQNFAKSQKRFLLLTKSWLINNKVYNIETKLGLLNKDYAVKGISIPDLENGKQNKFDTRTKTTNYLNLSSKKYNVQSLVCTK